MLGMRKLGHKINWQNDSSVSLSFVKWATFDLPKLAHPCVRSSVGVTSSWLDGWASLGKVVAGVLRRYRTSAQRKDLPRGATLVPTISGETLSTCAKLD